jgi:hypothetical protein
MTEREKAIQIRKWFQEGRIVRLSANSFSVSSEAFVMGITPRLVAKVLNET